MGQVLTRTAWNSIIQKINALGAMCAAFTPLTAVGPNHVWTKADVIAVQNTLKQICSTTTFPALSTPQLWLQNIIDQINNAITNNCQDCGGSGGGGSTLPSSASGHWVIVICDCASGFVHTIDANGNCIPFCQGCVGPFQYDRNPVWSGTNGSIALQLLAAYNANEYYNLYTPCVTKASPFRLLSIETWTALVAASPTTGGIGSCAC